MEQRIKMELPMRRDDSFQDEVVELAQSAVAEEVVDKVMSTFDKALNQLDVDSQSLLSEYFNGVTVVELSRARGLNPRDVEEWLSRSKRLLFQELRQECIIRQ
jgi:DNA-directed RNA polymerase specialized sigma24 family protein